MYTKHWARDRRQKAFQETLTEQNFESLRNSGRIEHGELSLIRRQSRYNKAEIEPFKYRVVEMCIAQGDRIIAIALFHEWCLDDLFFPGRRHFVGAADVITQQDYEMAEFVSELWSDNDHPLQYGNIILFDRLSIPVPDPLIWSCLLRAIDKQFSKKGALIVLKAFPLEFEARNEDEPGRSMADFPEFDRRQIAMKRHYRRMLGMNNSVGENDAKGWMWRVMRGPQPSFE